MKNIKSALLTLALAFSLSLVWNGLTYAGSPAGTSGTSPAKQDQSKDKNLAATPAKCMSKNGVTPRNCLFLEEPIGGRPGFDLYIVNCNKGKGKPCETELWNGGAIPQGARGPLQAILTEDPSKSYQGPFGLLYSYLTLFYNYMSGVIVGLAVLFIVVGGIQMITSSGGEGFDAGKKRITKALIGLVLWFLSSLILYTINPTFFSF